MQEVNLLKSLPSTKRNISKRKTSKDKNIEAEAKKFGKMYWDGPREFGYGGYSYDGRWKSVAFDIIKFYKLKPGMRVLDVGCGKGFLVKDLSDACKGLNVFGLDISKYALINCHEDVVGKLHYGSADELIFADNSFDLVISINTIHNLIKKRALLAIKEIQRVSRKHAFVQVDSYHNQEQKEIFESWVLTANYHGYPNEWLSLFAEAGYTGDYFWTIIN